MKVSDYIVEFLIQNKVTDVFGYPGGMVTHLMDSFEKYKTQITAHVAYHEQAAAFEACAYAQASNKIGVAYATSGPGATNLITGVCEAYFDSIPVIFITGQVNTNESKSGYNIRQRGFQETDIVSMVSSVTKYATYVEKPEDIPIQLEKAFNIALEGRKGPVLLDIPMNIQRSECDSIKISNVKKSQIWDLTDENKEILITEIKKAKRPCIIAGAGVKSNQNRELLKQFVEKFGMPVVTSMIAIDILPSDNPLNYGFLGAYGNRVANFVVAKSDLILCIGTRLDIRQVGGKRAQFAPNARIIRVDIDSNELKYQIREDELDINVSAEKVLQYLLMLDQISKNGYSEWLKVCNVIKKSLQGIDDHIANEYIKKISLYFQNNAVVTTDVGQNQVWVAQSLKVKENTQVIFSGGHGTMGYSIPAAIGAYYACKRPVISFSGDGGFQMNLQELQFIKREKLPITIIVFNNHALGMIRHFQEMYFEERYAQTVENQGYDVVDLKKIAEAYELDYFYLDDVKTIDSKIINKEHATLVEIDINMKTYVTPKLRFGEPNQDQEPLIDRKLYKKLMEL